MSRQEIGGFFGLEIAQGRGHYHPEALRLNLARNSLEYILRSKQYKKIYLPLYGCDVLLESLEKLGLEYEFYAIDEQLNPIFSQELGDDEAILCVNYFGLKRTTIERLAKKYGHKLIVDNAQAFFEKPVIGVDTFYSARKFFGVSDGAYLYMSQKLNESFEQDISFGRSTYLLKRNDISAEATYEDFQVNEKLLSDQPIKIMSNLTDGLLGSVDYERVRGIRRKNYLFFEEKLERNNLLKLELSDQVPMVYPFRTNDPSLREKLIKNHIFVATYWPNVLHQANKDALEYLLTQQIIPLPIDQRYNEEQLQTIVEMIL